MTQQSNRDAWRKFLGISDARNGRADSRTGVGVGRSAGRASGAGSTDRDGNPEGEAGENAEKGNGALDASKRLKTGDKGDRLEDLYDCETGEKVTLDGLGKEGTQAYPMSFQNCQNPGPPSDYIKGEFYSLSYNKMYYAGSTESGKIYYHSKSLALTGAAEIAGKFANCVVAGLATSGVAVCSSPDPSKGEYSLIAISMAPKSCSSDYNPICDTEPTIKWPEVDKNHLNWNKEKGCYEPLCPEHNTQVLDKYKGCVDELELCDAPVGGKKVKVKINNGVTEVTQERYNQTATIKDGKVTSVKALSESQTEAIFK